MPDKIRWKVYLWVCHVRYSVKSFNLKVRIWHKRRKAKALQSKIDKLKGDN